MSGRATRAAARALGATSITSSPPPAPSRKRKQNATADSIPDASEPSTKKRAISDEASTETQVDELASTAPAPVILPAEDELIPATLTFSMEDCKKHLIAADPRFAKIFAKLPCKPFEKLDAVEPFR